MDATINSFFINAGTPATGLTPTVSIWEVDGTPTQLIFNDPMIEVGDGFYVYTFLGTSGYTENGQFVIRTDGGATLGNSRYNIGSLAPQKADVIETSAQDITNDIWNANSSNYSTVGTMGYLVSNIGKLTPTTIAAIVDGVWDEMLSTHTVAGSAGLMLSNAYELLVVLLKYSENRTRIDIPTNTLTVYDNDNVTPIQVFTLKDHTGAPSTTEVYERSPN